MTPPYVPLETIQLLSETSFSKIKNKKIIWGGTLKWDTLYIYKREKKRRKNYSSRHIVPPIIRPKKRRVYNKRPLIVDGISKKQVIRQR